MRGRANLMVGSFFRMAHEFDDISTHLVERYMCSDVCPCRDYGSNPSTKELYMQQLKEFEDSGNVHNRTFDEADGNKQLMKFTKNETNSFTNFADCFEFW